MANVTMEAKGPSKVPALMRAVALTAAHVRLALLRHLTATHLTATALTVILLTATALTVTLLTATRQAGPDAGVGVTLVTAATEDMEAMVVAMYAS